MLRQYYDFNTVKFLKASRHWDDQIESLKQDLAAITEIGGTGEGMPTGSGISRPTEKTVLDREKVLQKMAEIDECRECFKWAWGCISREDQEILIGFYYAPGYVYDFVAKWCDQYISNRTYCYRAKREAEERLGKACKRWMELHT